MWPLLDFAVVALLLCEPPSYSVFLQTKKSRSIVFEDFFLLPDSRLRKDSWSFFPKCSWVKRALNTGCQDLLQSVLQFLHNSELLFHDLESIRSTLRPQIWLGFSGLSSIARRSGLSEIWDANFENAVVKRSPFRAGLAKLAEVRRCFCQGVSCIVLMENWSLLTLPKLYNSLLNWFLCVAHVQLRFSRSQNRTLS